MSVLLVKRRIGGLTSHDWLAYSLTGYMRLVMYSFGFQQAFKRGFQAEDHLFLEKVGVWTVVEGLSS